MAALLIVWFILAWAIMLIVGILGGALGFLASLVVAALLMLIRLLL